MADQQPNNLEVTGFLPPHVIRPAVLGDIKPPGILLPSDKYGATFLVFGEENDPTAVFLDGQYQFQSFKRGTNDHWAGIAIEDVQIELNFASIVDRMQDAKRPGMMIRKETQLAMRVIGERAFRDSIELPVVVDLPEATHSQEGAFRDWRVVITSGDRRMPIWRCCLENSES
jgi:hypothetical protein